MKAAVTVFVVIVVAVAVGLPADTYSAAWDDLDLEQILGNDRLVASYANCLLDKGACSPDAAALKRILPEALKTGCSKCTQKQKEGGIKVIKFLVENKPELWKEIVNKYDPNGTYMKKYTPKN